MQLKICLLPCAITPPTLDEIKQAVAKLKNNKAADTKGLIAEMLKQGADIVLPHIHKVVSHILRTRSFPNEWKHNVVFVRC